MMQDCFCCIKKSTSYACGSREVGTMIWENKTSFVKIKAGNANRTKQRRSNLNE